MWSDRIIVNEWLLWNTKRDWRGTKRPFESTNVFVGEQKSHKNNLQWQYYIRVIAERCDHECGSSGGKKSAQSSSRLCSRSIFSKFKRERKTRKGENKREKLGETGWGKEEWDSRLTLLYLHSLEKMWKNTIVLRLQQPTAYKPMSERKAVKLHFTQSTLTHYPIDQLYTTLFYKRLSCEGNWSCKRLYQEGGTSEAAAIVHMFLVFCRVVGRSRLHLYLLFIESQL